MKNPSLLLIAGLIAAPALAAPPRAGMVVASQRDAAEVGRQVLEDGGNAVDAAVAVAYALAVTDPCCGNIGGGGFMLLRRPDGATHFVDFRERAPLAATPTMFQDAHGKAVPERSRHGYLAVGTPGTVAGLDYARAKFGTRPAAALIGPAIDLAERGFVLGPGDTQLLGYFTADFARQPNVATVFLRPDGSAWREGDRLKQPALAATLRAIASGGPDAFYRGPVADAVAAASAANGGILTRADFEQYAPVERAPVACDYHGYQVVSAPPPSSGGVVLCEVLGIVAPFGLDKMAPRSADEVHDLVEAERRAYIDRNAFLGDPDFVANPVGKLISSENTARARATIRPDRATPSADVAPAAAEAMQTTHFSVLDKQGNAVSLTYTINGWFGAGVIAGETGFFLNNEMDDFGATTDAPNQYGLVQGAPNAPGPGKRPLSSMTPTIVLRDGAPVLIVGAPGGSRIPTEVLGVVVNVLDHGMAVADAVTAPRVHEQAKPDTVYVEPGALSPEARAALEGEGYSFTEQHPWGLAEAIMIAPDGAVTGGADPRRPGGTVAEAR